jgi:hypothetical protein
MSTVFETNRMQLTLESSVVNFGGVFKFGSSGFEA